MIGWLALALALLAVVAGCVLDSWTERAVWFAIAMASYLLGALHAYQIAIGAWHTDERARHGGGWPPMPRPIPPPPGPPTRQVD